MPGEADRLRRSKRNKFFLDVSSLGTTDRRRTQPVPQLSPCREDPKTRTQSASPMRAGSSASSSTQEEDTKRPRRANRSSNFYYEDDSDDDDDTRVCGMFGRHKCDKCPSRFETRPGLANHMRLHGGVNRKHTCEVCDFSCGSLKAIRNHRKCHRRLDKETTPTHSDTRSEDDSNTSPPKLTPEVQKESTESRCESTLSSPPLLNGKSGTESGQEPSSCSSATDSSTNSTPTEAPVEPTTEGEQPTSNNNNNNNNNSDTNNSSSNSNTNEVVVATPQIKQFECPHCPFKCRNRRRLVSHTEGHRKSTGYRCHRCSMTTTSSGFLKVHITQIHKETSKYPWPPKYFVQDVEQPSPNKLAASLKEKLEMKHKLRSKIFPREGRRADYKLFCPVPECSHFCYLTSQLVSHKFVQHNLKPNQPNHRCVTCGMSFKRRGTLCLHRIKKHPKRKLNPKVKSLLYDEARGRHFLKGIYNARNQAAVDDLNSSLTQQSDMSQQTVAAAAAAAAAQASMPIASPPFPGVQMQSPMMKSQQMPMFNVPSTQQGMLPPHMHPQALHHMSPGPSGIIMPNGQTISPGHHMSMLHGQHPQFMMQAGINAMQHPSVIQHVPPQAQRAPELPHYLKTVSSEVIDVLELPRILDQAFKCGQCPYTATARAKLEKHVARHKAPSDLKCPVCTYQCRGEAFMQQHFRVHVALAQRITRLTVNNPNSDMTSAVILSAASCMPLVQSLGLHLSMGGNPVPNPPPSGPTTVGAAATAAVAAARLMRNERMSLTNPRTKKERTFLPLILPDGTRLRRCLECPYASKHSCDISTHYQMHLTAPQKFRCSQCTYSTKRSVCLRVHYEQHRAQNTTESIANPLPLKVNGVPIGIRSGTGKLRIYSCKMCPFAGRTISSLWRHARNHVFIRNPTYRCPSCEFFGNKDVLDQHVLLHTPEVHPVLLRSSQTPVTMKREAPENTSTSSSTKHVVKSRKSNHRLSTEPNSKVTTPSSATPPPPTLSPAPILTRECNVSELKTEDIKREPVEDIKYENQTASSSRSSKNSEASSLKYDGPLSVDIIDSIVKVHPILARLRREEECQVGGQCSDCPYTDTDEVLMRIHRDMHSQPPRTHQCELCSFSSNTPQCLYRHISLHLPPLSPGSTAALKQKTASRRRYQQAEIIPSGVKHFSCYKCSFRTVHNDKFMEHIYQHVEDYRRRLNTTTKREQMTEESKRIKVQRRNPRKTDKLFSCEFCSFRSETITALSRHFEMHSLHGIYPCSMCTYSSNTRSITQFHEMNHHSDHSATNLQKSAILAPDAIRLQIDSSKSDIPKLAGQMFNCVRCNNFSCIESRDLENHWKENHNETPEDKEQAMYISFGLFNANGIATIA